MKDELPDLLAEAAHRRRLSLFVRDLNPRRWATEVAQIRLPKTGLLDFEEHPFMVGVYEDLHPEIVVIKGAQLGFSVWSICRSFWAATQFSLSVIYTFPTGNDVTKFTQARINPIISGSHYLSERVLDVNSVQIKQFSRIPAREYRDLRSKGVAISGVSTLYFSGAQTERDAQSVDADLLIHDEEDRSNPQIIEQLQERLAHSKTRWRVRLSTPTFPGAGVDKTWALSDQRAWMHTCSRCNATFEMHFPSGVGDPESCILPYSYADVLAGDTARYICPKCHEPLREEDRRRGQWVVMYPDRTIHGYHVSQMSAPWVSALSVLHKRHTATWEGDFWNLVMGIPFAEGTTAMTRANFLGPPGHGLQDPMRPPAENSAGSYAGVDVGRMLDIQIEEMVAGSPRIIRMLRLDTAAGGWDELANVIRRFNIVSGVIDGMPETQKAREFVDAHPGWYLAYYGGGREVKVDEEKRTVTAPRDSVLSKRASELLGTPGILPRYDASDAYEAFIKHHEASKRVPVFVEGLETDKVIDHYEWRETGPDHQFHAGTYAMLARQLYEVGGVPLVGLRSFNRAEPSLLAGLRKEGALSPYEGERAIMGRRFRRR